MKYRNTLKQCLKTRLPIKANKTKLHAGLARSERGLRTTLHAAIFRHSDCQNQLAQ